MADTQEQQYESRHSPERDERRERSSERRDAEPERRERNDDPEGTNLYVANLNFDTQEEDLRRLFEPFGAIMDCSIVMDPMTRKSRGFGFVRFERSDDAMRAIDENSGKEFDGRTIRVEKANRNRPHPKTPGQYLGPATASAKYGIRRPPSWADDRYDDRRYDDRRDRYDRYSRDDRYGDSRSRDRDGDYDRHRDSRDRDRRRDSRDRERRHDSRDRDRHRDSRDRDRRRDDYDRHDRR